MASRLSIQSNRLDESILQAQEKLKGLITEGESLKREVLKYRQQRLVILK